VNVGVICNPTGVFAYANVPLGIAARRMLGEHVGNLVVIEEGGRGRMPGGMLTGGDMVVEVAVACRRH